MHNLSQESWTRSKVKSPSKAFRVGHLLGCSLARQQSELLYIPWLPPWMRFPGGRGGRGFCSPAVVAARLPDGYQNSASLFCRASPVGRAKGPNEQLQW